MADRNFKDPADKGKSEREAENVESKIVNVEAPGIKLGDFKAIPKETTRTANPFDGYPETKVVIGQHKDLEKKKPDGSKNPNFGKMIDLTVNKSWVIALNPAISVFQDVSGLGVVIGDPKKGNEKVVNMAGTHNRTVSYGGQAVKMVWDRPLETDDGQNLMICIIPDPIYRALIFFFYNSTAEKIDVYPEYLLWDYNSRRPLYRTFEMIINPRLKLERRIEEQFYGTSDDDSYKQADMPGIATA